MNWLDRLICRVNRHSAALLKFADGRMSLACSCGWESDGVQVHKPTQQRIQQEWNPRAEAMRRFGKEKSVSR